MCVCVCVEKGTASWPEAAVGHLGVGIGGLGMHVHMPAGSVPGSYRGTPEPDRVHMQPGSRS